MTTADPLVIKYLSQLRGHVVKKYRWMELRGNCLVTIDDIVQVASIVLMKLADRWDDLLAEQGKTRDGNNGMFWRYLENEVKSAVITYYRRTGKEGVEALDSSFDGEINEKGWLESEARTRGSAPRDKIHWGAVRNDIVDYFQTMPLKDKIYIALRYFDELPAETAAALLGTSEKTYTNQTASFVSRWRDHATNQLVVNGETRDVAKRVEYAWESLDTLTDYVRDRHRADLHEYVWYVSECFRQDVGYLAAILGRQRRSSERLEGGRTSVTPAQRREIDHMLDQNFNCVQIAHQLGVSYAAVLWTRDNPRPIR